MLDIASSQQNQVGLFQENSVFVPKLTRHHMTMGYSHHPHGGNEQIVKLFAVVVGRADVGRLGFASGKIRPNCAGQTVIVCPRKKQLTIRQKIERRDQEGSPRTCEASSWRMVSSVSTKRSASVSENMSGGRSLSTL